MIQALFIFSLLFVWPVFTSHTSHNRDNEQTPIDPPFNNQESRRWADSLFKTLTPDERLGQLFMVAAYSNKDEAEKKRIEYLIKNHHIGGIIFMQGGPVRQASLTNYYQSISKVQLMIAQDAEWGLSMRLDSTPDFHRQLMWGAIQNNQLIYKAGREIARECRRLGVHISFSPVVDINSNPLNPVIGDRSFGENKINVAEKGIAYMRGLQDGKVLASAKHFPGHGDTDKDSHKTLPTVTASASRIDSLELYPFIKLVNSGVGSVMVAHLNIPSLDSSGTASTLSSNVVTGLLKNKIGFNGLIFTDALNMKGVADLYPAGEVDVRALIAGNDVLLFSGNVSGAITAIKKAVQDNVIEQDSIDAKVKKILACKHWLELNKKQRVDLKNLHKDINTPEALHIRDELTASALTLVRNKSNLIPFKQRLDTFRFASVSIGSFNETNFQKRLKTYAPVKSFHIDKQASKEDFQKLIDLLKNYNVVFVSLHNMNRKFDNNYGITDNSKLFINELEKKCHVVTTLFGNPYSLKFFEKSNHLLMAYSGENDVQDFAAQLLFGGIPARGKLPVSASDEIKAGEGLFTTSCRLRFTDPTDYDFIPNKLNQIDSILEAAIINRAFPGCRMLAIKNNTIFYDKAYGFYTYDRIDSVQLNAVYDVASITKTAATTLAIMRLYEEKKINLNDPINKYLPWLSQSNKANTTLKELLLHQGGLKAWIPFYKTIQTKDDAISYTRNRQHYIQIADNMYLRHEYLDTIKMMIMASPVSDKKEYVYSDLDFILLGWIVEAVTNSRLDDYVRCEIYAPLGISQTTYLPLDYLEKKNIVPSNYDYDFRRQKLVGFVHDPGSALMGGVAGHAGLFSDTYGLAVIHQMLLNHGTYGGYKVFDSATVDLFTSKQSTISRRGLGFDKQEPNVNKKSPCSELASDNTFGHQGFTGTCVWSDPLTQLTLIFLSNRTFPDDTNNKISTMAVRTKIHTLLYESVVGHAENPGRF